MRPLHGGAEAMGPRSAEVPVRSDVEAAKLFHCVMAFRMALLCSALWCV